MQPTLSNQINKNTNSNHTQKTSNNSNNNKSNGNNTNHFDIGKICLSYPEVDGLVYSYLKSRGYQSALNALVSESSADLNCDQILASNALHVITDKHKTMLHSIYGYTHSDHNIKWFGDSYRYLYLWINQCLDCYRIELQIITYPVFIHFIFELLLKSQIDAAKSFYYKYNGEHNTLHSQDVSAIYNLIETMDNTRIESHTIYNRYRKHKYQISISIISHNLLMSWLNSSKLNLLIKTINNHIDFRIISHSPSMSSIKDNIICAPLGIDNNKLIEMNKQKIEWGISRYMDQIETKALRERQSITNIKNRLIRTEFAEIHPSQPKYSKDDEKLIHNDIKNRVYSGPDRLPSICCYKFINAKNIISCSNISQNGKWIIGGCNDSTIKVFNKNADTHCNSLIGHKSSITQISIYNEFAISSSTDCTVRLWSLERGHCLSWYRGHCFPIWSIDFSPLGLYFATASHDRTSRLWSTDRGVPLRIFAGHITDVECIRFHPNCNYIVTGSSDRTIRCWDIQSGDCVRLMSGHTNTINDLQFTSDGRCIVSASKDKTIRIWDIATSECISVLKAHTDSVTKITLAHTVNRNAVIINTNSTSISSFPLVISSGMDNTIRFWDVNNPQKPLIKTINTNVCVSHLEMSKSNLLMMAGTVI